MNNSLLQKLLDFYSIDYDQYLLLNKDYTLDNFYGDAKFDDIKETVSFVKAKIKNNSKIIIYGDYDADGIMGTSILKRMFDILNYHVDFYLPNRHNDGYGINVLKAKEYVEQKYDLVITVDNGVTANEPIEILRNNNIDVVVLDHHLVGEKMPNANYIIHPIYSHFSDIPTSGAFVAYMFATEMLGYPDKYLATLAAISTVSDMMPLKDINRNFLRCVFKNYCVGEFLQIDLLSEKEKLDEIQIGMKIAPKINSIGRLTEDNSINDIVDYFTSNDNGFILNYYSYIETSNSKRKELLKEKSLDLDLDLSQNGYVLTFDVSEGLIGLLANNIVNKYHKPVIVFCYDCDNKIYKGSARSPEGFNIVEMFNNLKQYLITFGGHASAGGCTVSKENFEAFTKASYGYFDNHKIEVINKPTIDINFIDFNFGNYALINSFSPFGEGWPQPTFKIKSIKTSSFNYSKNHDHILTMVGTFSKIVGFNYPKNIIEENDYVDLIGTFRLNSYSNSNYLEFLIKDINPLKK